MSTLPSRYDGDDHGSDLIRIGDFLPDVLRDLAARVAADGEPATADAVLALAYSLDRRCEAP